MTLLEKAAIQRANIIKAMASLDDQEASKTPELSPFLNYDNSLISAGTRINWNGQLKRAAVDLWDTKANNPDNAPTLWENIDYKDGYRIIPETITAGTAFAKDEYGWWKDVLYRSTIDANVWTPDAYPTAWQIIE